MCVNTYIPLGRNKFLEGWKGEAAHPENHRPLSPVRCKNSREFLGQIASSFQQHRVTSSKEAGAAVGEVQVSGVVASPLLQQRGRPCPGESLARAGIRGVSAPVSLRVLRVRREEPLGSPKSDVFESRSGEPGALRVFSYLKYVNKYYCGASAAVVL